MRERAGTTGGRARAPRGGGHDGGARVFAVPLSWLPGRKQRMGAGDRASGQLRGLGEQGRREPHLIHYLFTQFKMYVQYSSKLCRDLAYAKKKFTPSLQVLRANSTAMCPERAATRDCARERALGRNSFASLPPLASRLWLYLPQPPHAHPLRTHRARLVPVAPAILLLCPFFSSVRYACLLALAFFPPPPLFPPPPPTARRARAGSAARVSRAHRLLWGAHGNRRGGASTVGGAGTRGGDPQWRGGGSAGCAGASGGGGSGGRGAGGRTAGRGGAGGSSCTSRRHLPRPSGWCSCRCTCRAAAGSGSGAAGRWP